MEDERGKEHIKLSTDHSGKSQLNLGHLVDATKARRGEGFELRTDGRGAIRAGKGLFISADQQAGAQGQQLEMAAAITHLQDAVQQLQTLSTDAQASKAEPAGVEAQVALLEQNLEQLKSAVMLLSAPQGIALTSGKHLQLAAHDNVMLNAGGDTDVSVVKRMFMGVGRGLSVFVRQLGIKLIANQGPVTVQAQNDTLELLARQGLRITSTEDEIHIVAKKKIVLNAAGSYLTLEQGLIESGTAGDHLLKAANFNYIKGAATMAADHPDYPPRRGSSGDDPGIPAGDGQRRQLPDSRCDRLPQSRAGKAGQSGLATPPFGTRHTGQPACITQRLSRAVRGRVEQHPRPARGRLMTLPEIFGPVSFQETDTVTLCAPWYVQDSEYGPALATYKPLVNGEDTFRAVHEAIEKATHSVRVLGWEAPFNAAGLAGEANLPGKGRIPISDRKMQSATDDQYAYDRKWFAMCSIGGIPGPLWRDFEKPAYASRGFSLFDRAEIVHQARY
nr:hypothetical protein [Tanacetum cinerariifolium]